MVVTGKKFKQTTLSETRQTRLMNTNELYRQTQSINPFGDAYQYWNNNDYYDGKKYKEIFWLINIERINCNTIKTNTGVQIHGMYR